jgi:SAM-dependent methyltransferase
MASDQFKENRVRGRANAAFFTVAGGYLDYLTRERKTRIFQHLAEPIVEIGPGVGANFCYLTPGAHVIAVEPNPHMHQGLRKAAGKHGIQLDLRTVVGERIDVEDASAGSAITTLVLCTVADPRAVLHEVHRVLRPGGFYAFLEHVVAPERTITRRVQRVAAKPWSWAFEGCSCERDLAPLINQAGFSQLNMQQTQLRSFFVPANPQIAGIAIK